MLFSDDFKTVDPGWGTDVPIKDGKLTVEPDLSSTRWYLNETNVFEDMTCSIKVRMAAGDEETWGGLVFWARDQNNFYQFQISPKEGKVSVSRMVSGRWISPVSARDCPDIKKALESGIFSRWWFEATRPPLASTAKRW